MSGFRNDDQRIEFVADVTGTCVVDPEGCHHEDGRDAVMNFLVGTTGGLRDDVFEFVADILRTYKAGTNVELEDIAEIVRKDSRIAAEFVANVLRHGFLLESAGFVYWTTPRGEQWVEIADRDGEAA